MHKSPTLARGAQKICGWISVDRQLGVAGLLVGGAVIRGDDNTIVVGLLETAAVESRKDC